MNDEIQKITSKINWIIYNNESFYILDLEDGIKAKGHIFNTGKSKLRGLVYEFTGRFKTDKYGRSFHFESATLKTDEMYFFLTSVVKGIGEKGALAIMERFGDETADIIENKPHRLTEVSGIGKKRIVTITESYKKFSHIRKLTEFLSPFGFSSLMINEIFGFYSHQAIDLIKDDPYILCNIKGIHFKTVDEMALKMGIIPNDSRRIKSGLIFYMKKKAFNTGNLWEYADNLIFSVLRQLRLSNEFSETVLEILKSEEEFFFLDQDTPIVALTENKDFEDFISDFLIERTESPLNISDKIHDEDMQEFSSVKLSDMQKAAVKNSCSYLVSAICGYAGTGKTTVCKVLMNLLKKHWSKRIAGCAMSGIAARRLEEITGFSCHTIHSLLGFDGEDFRHNEENLLEYDVIILDEAGMVNSFLFYSLIRCLHKECILVVIGDDAQLPPIGPGNVFADILNNDLMPFKRLTEVFRQSEDSVINIFASKIREGKIPKGYEESHNDWYFSMCNNDLYGLKDDNILKRLISVAKKFVNDNPEADPVTGLQILTPMKKGELGTINLNQMLKEIINPAFDKTSFKRMNTFFSEGDKVIHLKNIERKIYLSDEYRFGEEFAKSERIFNGSIGIIEKIDLLESKVFVRMYTKEIVQYDIGDFRDIIDHAFALTVHKAQGSEFERVIIPITQAHSFMLDNQWLYTALTRAKRGIVFIGENRAFEKAASNISKKKRNTFLSIDVYTLMR